MIAIFAAAALAAEPACTQDLAAAPDRLSVAWVSPLGARVGANGWLTVVSTTSLRQFVAAERPGVGRLLQHLGERRRATDPHRRYKITIFDVEAGSLCRPVEGLDEPDLAGGMAACPKKKSDLHRAYTGCGVLTDLANMSASLQVYRLTWADAAYAGFCVLPVERFLGL